MALSAFRLPARVKQTIHDAFFVLALLVLLLMLGALFVRYGMGATALPPAPVGLKGLAGAVLLYLLAHVLRVARLSILIEDAKVGLRQVFLIHYFTSAVSLVMPFKLGEVYRIFELNLLLRRGGRAFLIVWIERAFDIGLICLMLLFTAYSMPTTIPLVQPLIGLSLAFTFVSAFAFVVLPENLRLLTLYIIRRYNSDRALAALRLIDATQSLVVQGRRLVRGKLATLFALTVGIWFLELQVLAALLPGMAMRFKSLVANLQVYLSSVSMSGGYLKSLFTPTQGHLVAYLPQLPWASAVYYQLVLTAPLVVLGLVAALIYLRKRLNRIPPLAHAKGKFFD